MPSFIRNKFDNMSQFVSNQSRLNISNQIKMIQEDSGAILDILLQNGKINQQQYAELQPYRNNPQMIFNYLSNNGNYNELNGYKQQVEAKMGNM